MKLETFYNQDPLRYLNEGDSDFEDLDVGHVVTKAFFSAVESDYLEPKTFWEALDYNDLEIKEKCKTRFENKFAIWLGEEFGNIARKLQYQKTGVW